MCVHASVNGFSKLCVSCVDYYYFFNYALRVCAPVRACARWSLSYCFGVCARALSWLCRLGCSVSGWCNALKGAAAEPQKPGRRVLPAQELWNNTLPPQPPRAGARTLSRTWTHNSTSIFIFAFISAAETWRQTKRKWRTLFIHRKSDEFVSPCVSVGDKDVALIGLWNDKYKVYFGNIDYIYILVIWLYWHYRDFKDSHIILFYLFFLSVFEFVHEVIIQFIIALDLCY